MAFASAAAIKRMAQGKVAREGALRERYSSSLSYPSCKHQSLACTTRLDAMFELIVSKDLQQLSSRERFLHWSSRPDEYRRNPNVCTLRRRSPAS